MMRMHGNMTIHIKPEQERIIGQAIKAGLIETADQAVELGMETIRRSLEGSRKTFASPARNLVELFADSPFAGLNMDFERDEDPGRAIEI
jgi:hypothetical protein